MISDFLLAMVSLLNIRLNYFSESHHTIKKPVLSLVPGAGIEPAQPQGPRDFKSLASTNSATQAKI